MSYYVRILLIFSSGLSIYIVTVASVISAPISLLIDEPNLRYLSMSLLTLIPITLILCLIFILKVRIICQLVSLH